MGSSWFEPFIMTVVLGAGGGGCAIGVVHLVPDPPITSPKACVEACLEDHPVLRGFYMDEDGRCVCVVPGPDARPLAHERRERAQFR